MNRPNYPRNVAVTLLAVLVLGIVVQYGGPLRTSPAYASTSQNLSGYAWSDNIGWISFNCTNSGGSCAPDYGVNISPSTGNFSGYAWSDNIGWVSFSETTGCPESGCITQPNFNLTTKAVTGWAKALSANGNGWDGWIKLSGTTPSAYGPSVSGTAFSGYSWGSDVVGWVSWSGVTVAPMVTVSLQVNGALSTTIDSGQSATLSWTSNNAESCTSVGSWWPPGAGTTDSASTGVIMTGPQSFIMSCSDAFGNSVNSNLVTVNVNMPVVEISATPTRVRSGDTSTITWSASQVTDCTIVGEGIPLASTRTDGLPTSQVVTVIAQQTYTITCNTAYGSTIPRSAIVNVGTTTIREF